MSVHQRTVEALPAIDADQAAIMDSLVPAPQCATLFMCAHVQILVYTSNLLLLAHSTSAAAPLLFPGPSFPPGTRAPVSMVPGVPTVFSGASGAPPAPYSAMQSAGAPQGAALQPTAGTPSQPTPYASEFMTPPAWPMYIACYMPRAPALQALMQAEFGELARQCQDLEAHKLEVQCMTQTPNLNAVRDARVATATSTAVSRHSRRKEQAPRHASSQIASQLSQTPSGAPASGIEVISTGITRTY